MQKAGTLIFLFFLQLNISGQIHFHDASVELHHGVVLGIHGDVAAETDLIGNGSLLMIDSVPQNIHFNGHELSGIQIENAQGIDLVSNLNIKDRVEFISGTINLNQYNLNLSHQTILNGYSNQRFFNTNGLGKLHRMLEHPDSNLIFPIGINQKYRPVKAEVDAISGNAFLALSVKDTPEANHPLRIIDRLNIHWPYKMQGTGNHVRLTTHYAPLDDMIGNPSNIRSYVLNGTEWSSANGTHDASQNELSISVDDTMGSLYAMNKFVLMGAKAFLQGCYDATSGMMYDSLRSPNRLLPFSDPYRSTLYRSSFVHIDNPIIETAPPSVFQNHQVASNDIVDWVFLELRDTSTSNNQIVQTRAVLMQRDGDITEIDGVSPVCFIDVPDGNYTLTIRHRNHLAMSLDPQIGFIHLNEMKSNASQSGFADFSTAHDDVLYGSPQSHATASNNAGVVLNLMWAGNMNEDEMVRISGKGNDRRQLLEFLNFNEDAEANGYHKSDVNMNGKVNFSGFNSDIDYLKNKILGGNIFKIIKEEKLQ